MDSPTFTDENRKGDGTRRPLRSPTRPALSLHRRQKTYLQLPAADADFVVSAGVGRQTWTRGRARRRGNSPTSPPERPMTRLRAPGECCCHLADASRFDAATASGLHRSPAPFQRKMSGNARRKRCVRTNTLCWSGQGCRSCRRSSYALTFTLSGISCCPRPRTPFRTFPFAHAHTSRDSTPSGAVLKRIRHRPRRADSSGVVPALPEVYQ